MTDPTTGGVSASLAMLGDLNIAEPRALIGFAGPRVIQQTVRETLPEGFQRSEFLLEHGGLDMIVDRREHARPHRRMLRLLPAKSPPRLEAPALEPMRSLEQWLAYQAAGASAARIDLGLERVATVLERLRWRQPRVPGDHRRRHQRQGLGGRHCAAMLAARRVAASARSPRRTCATIASASASTAREVERRVS